MKMPVAEFLLFGVDGVRRGSHPGLWIAFVCAVMALPQAFPAQAQNASPHRPPYMDRNSPIPGRYSRIPQPAIQNGNDSYLNAVRLAQLKAERAKALDKDSSDLLKLARELNAEVRGANAAPLGKAQLRKVAKIAKLAHSVEADMELTYNPRLQSPSAFPEALPNPIPRRYPHQR